MKAVLAVMELFRQISVSYGNVFLMVGTLIGKGSNAFQATWETLSQEKYKAVKDHFQAGTLHLIAALAEFKKGRVALMNAVGQNPDDFKVLTEFINDVKVNAPKSIEAAFSSTDEFSESLGDSFSNRIPDFIRTSGEYMEAINVGKIECDEVTFRAQLKETFQGSITTLRQAHKAKKHIEETGWAKIEVKPEDGDPFTLVYWADEFDISEFVPEHFEVITKDVYDGSRLTDVKLGDSYYRIKPVGDNNHESIMKIFDEKYGNSGKE